MFDFRPIFLVNGVLIALLGMAMLVPAVVDVIYIFRARYCDVFLGAAFVTAFV